MTLQTMYPGMINSPQTELAQAIDDTQTTIPLLDASVLPAAPNLATIGTGEDAETVLYTGKSGNNLTGVTRGFQGAAKSWGAGVKVARNFTAYDYDALRKNLEDHAAAIAQAVKKTGDTMTGDLILAGTQLHLYRPNTTGTWARGILLKDKNGSVYEGGIGFLGSGDNQPQKVYIGFGSSPWDDTNGLMIRQNSLKFKGKDVVLADDLAVVQTNLDNHASATTGVHGATSAATANTIIQRDSAGRAKVAAPAAADDIANKSYVDNAVANLGNIDQRLAFTAGIQDGDANDDVSLIKSVQHHTHTRSVVLIYSNGRLSSVEERNGSDTVKSTVLNYDSNGRLSSIVEVAGGVTVTQTLNYDGSGNLTSVTRAVS